jgi:hypothetical protein
MASQHVVPCGRRWPSSRFSRAQKLIVAPQSAAVKATSSRQPAADLDRGRLRADVVRVGSAENVARLTTENAPETSEQSVVQ